MFFAIHYFKHFGNDHDFFARLGAYTTSFLDREIAALQLTKPKADGSVFVSFSKTNSAYISQYNNKLKITYTKPKSSRVNNLCNLYLHVGKQVPELWNKFKQTGNVSEISMGNILIT